jgi:hypothetical protein
VQQQLALLLGETVAVGGVGGGSASNRGYTPSMQNSLVTPSSGNNIASMLNQSTAVNPLLRHSLHGNQFGNGNDRNN